MIAGGICCRAQLSAYGDIVGNRVAGGVLDRGDPFNGDRTGDGLDDVHRSVLQGRACGPVKFSGAYGVNKVLCSTCVAGVAHEDLPGFGRDIGDGPVLEVDEARTNEEEQQNERDHHVVVQAAAFVGPEEVVAEEAGWIAHAMPRTRWGVMTVSPFM